MFVRREFVALSFLYFADSLVLFIFICQVDIDILIKLYLIPTVPKKN